MNNHNFLHGCFIQVTAEAFEDAGIIAEELQTPRRPEVARQKCGIFVGVGMVDYLIQGTADAKMMNAYTLTGKSCYFFYCSMQLSS